MRCVQDLDEMSLKSSIKFADYIFLFSNTWMTDYQSAQSVRNKHGWKVFKKAVRFIYYHYPVKFNSFRNDNLNAYSVRKKLEKFSPLITFDHGWSMNFIINFVTFVKTFVLNSFQFWNKGLKMGSSLFMHVIKFVANHACNHIFPAQTHHPHRHPLFHFLM